MTALVACTFEDDADHEEDGGAQEIEEDSVDGVEVVDLTQIGVHDLCGVILPLEANQKHHEAEQHPEEGDRAIGIELGKAVDDEDLPPRVLPLLPIDHEHLEA
jgi:hypothetical protein